MSNFSPLLLLMNLHRV
ncbi:hypothetical protein Gotri_005391 [Gossypium trilobum]|uniref:Uncharacterized protein n=1 Tax=Gossypium trilobum TaxID=34281 RepID=A0A7J9EWD6_9ROSI|nr:hypothetical protein [Gossypium trilobum]